MDKTYYLESLSRKFQRHFEIKNNETVFQKKFDIYAKFSETTGRTFVTQKDIIDKFQINEHCLIQTVEELDLQEVSEFSEFLKLLTMNLVKPHKDHKSTNITGVLVSESPIGQDIKNFVKRFNYSKYYKFYLQGYSDVRLIVVDLANRAVITNRKGEEVKKVYLPTP
jgi:hypothetical protein